MTEDRIITYFVIIDHLLKELRLSEEPQAVLSNSEVLTMAVIAHIDFCANYSKALDWLKSFCSHLFPKVPDKSTFSRRLEKLLPLYTVDTVDDALEMLTGMSAEKFHKLVMKKLREFPKRATQIGKKRSV